MSWPGKQHADLNAPGAAKPLDQAIVNPAKLPRDRQLALCSLCHGGIGIAKAPAFSFTVGDALEDFLKLEIPKPDEALDVHGNQVALLERSKCFKSSEMTCSTCHNVHVRQREVGDFSEKCLACHKVESCGLFPKRGRAMVGKCVDCHLPNQTSNVIFSTHDGVRIQAEGPQSLDQSLQATDLICGYLWCGFAGLRDANPMIRKLRVHAMQFNLRHVARRTFLCADRTSRSIAPLSLCLFGFG